MSIAMMLDLAIAATDTVFNLAYARVAASPDCGASWALPRLVGYRKALEIALLSDDIDAINALAIGLVNWVVPRPSLEEETARIAARLAAGPATAQGHIKTLMRQSLDQTIRAQLDAESRTFAACATTADFTEAVDAFLSKRRPVFATGRN